MRGNIVVASLALAFVVSGGVAAAEVPYVPSGQPAPIGQSVPSDFLKIDPAAGGAPPLDAPAVVQQATPAVVREASMPEVVEASRLGLGARDTAVAVEPPEVWVGPPLSDLLADLVMIDKSDRRLRLYRQGQVIGEYPIKLGFAPEGHKLARGDGRTPEGFYRIDKRNPVSSFYLSLGISYPSQTDTARAMAAGFDPGGDIFLHGQPNGSPPGTQIKRDWTEGCIALSDAAIREIWSRVPTGIPISITP